MATLTDDEKVLVRYYCGYGMYGTQALPANGYRFSIAYGTLEYKMITLEDAEYAKVELFLTELPLLESDITSVRLNMDTAQAAVWYWNKNELRDRVRLYNVRRLALCALLGIPPGPSLQAGGIRMCM